MMESPWRYIHMQTRRRTEQLLPCKEEISLRYVEVARSSARNVCISDVNTPIPRRAADRQAGEPRLLKTEAGPFSASASAYAG